jgi:hypothetical protein
MKEDWWATWFAAMLTIAVYFRASRRFMPPALDTVGCFFIFYSIARDFVPQDGTTSMGNSSEADNSKLGKAG